MNMEEWQRKLKTEKDAARKKKTESAEMLRGYRGEINDEDLKLKILRDEERKRQLDAQQNLHNYKNTQLQESLKPKGQRPEQHYPTPVNAGETVSSRDPMEGIVLGSVSERAAVFDANPAAPDIVGSPDTAGAPDIEEAPTDERQMMSTLAENNSSALGPTTATEEDDDDDDDFGPSIPQNCNSVLAREVQDPLPIEIPANESVADPIPEHAFSETPALNPIVLEQISMNDSSSIPSNVDDPFAFQQQEIDPPVEIPSMEPHVPSVVPPSPDVAPALPLISSSNGISSGAAIDPTMTEALFSFGLVTIRSQPELTSYMKAVQKIVDASSKDGKNQFRYVPNNLPYVKDLLWDASFISRSGRSDVKRLVVTAAVPISVLGTTTASKAKETVVAALQAAIQSGDFLSFAQGN